MSVRARVVAVVAGLGALAGGGVATASVDSPRPGPVSDTRSGEALSLLRGAVRSARTMTWSGTQYVTSWQEGRTTSAFVEVDHDPVAGSVVREDMPGATPVAVPVDLLDTRLLDLLADRYALEVVRAEQCAGRPSRVVEASRPDGSVAGRFWLDDASGVVVRRELLDNAGRTVRSAVFVDLTVAHSLVPVSYVAGVPQLRPTGERVDPGELRREGWPVQEALPGGLALYDARWHDAVLQLSYSDGLSTTSVFVQRGRLRGLATAGPAPAALGGPERIVGSGAGMTWTVLSDGPSETAQAVAAALPHQRDPGVDDDVADRAWRGLARLGSWLDPFR